MSAKLIILDRDGTINVQRDGFVKEPKEWQALAGAYEAIARLNQAGWRVVVATNQSGIGRGMFDMASMNAVHVLMHKQMAAVGAKIDAVFFCPHAPEENCTCRKPDIGMFEQIAKRFAVSLKGVACVGDSLRDMQAAELAGCEPHLVMTGNGARYLSEAIGPPFPAKTQKHIDLAAFADAWLTKHPK